MPYIKCPSCHAVSFASLRRRELVLCSECGDPLGFPRTVVSVSRSPVDALPAKPACTGGPHRSPATSDSGSLLAAA